VTRCGVFLCECGGNISGVLDLPALAAGGRSLDGVVNVTVSQFLCGAEAAGSSRAWSPIAAWTGS